MKKKAFTLVELIVVITILAILGTIAFISLSGYSAEARDSKRITDTSNLLSKINVENVRGINMSELINPLGKKTNILTINSKKEDGLQGYPNFNALMEPEENFLDPKSKHRYPFAYAIGGEGKESYNFMQMATVSEKDGRARLVGNYYKFNDDTDSPSLFVQEGKDGEDKDNDYIVDNGEVPPYDIGVPVAPLPPKSCPTGEQLVNGKCEAIICLEDEYLDGNDCIKHWTGDKTHGFTYKNSSGTIVYPKNCNELLTNPIFKKGTTAPYNGTKFVDGFYNIKLKENQNPTKSYCDMTNDGAGWTRIYKNTSTAYEATRYVTCKDIGYYYSDTLECINPDNFTMIKFTRGNHNFLTPVKDDNGIDIVAWRNYNSGGPVIGWSYFVNYTGYTMRDYTSEITGYNSGRWGYKNSGRIQNDIIVYGK